jgi:DNA polymerase-3 subunit gamma/tau
MVSMSYVVLARRWRPQRFEEIVAQDHVTVTLRNAIKAGRIAHAYLFTGPRGIGKTTTARILAKALNCERREGVEPCGECPSCTEIVGSRSLDVLEIDGASNRGIDEIRNLRENVKYAPARGPYKVYIIDEVHMLTAEAFNALLKTLEEPPTHVIFIFATTQPHRVPATIVSRCQRFDFRKIPSDAITRRLEAIIAQEKMDVDSDVLPLLARKADGSLRDAESMLDQLVSFGEERITVEDAHSLLGLVDEHLYKDLTDRLVTGDAGGALEVVAEVDERGYDLVEFVRGFLEHLRSLLFERLGVGSSAPGAAGGRTAATRAELPDLEPEDLLRMMRALSVLEASMRRSSQPRILLETELVRLAHLDSTVLLSDLLSRLAAMEERLGRGAYPAEEEAGPRQEVAPRSEPREPNELELYGKNDEGGADAAASSPPARAVTLERIENVWQDLVEKVKRRKISLGTFLAEGKPARLVNGSLLLAFYGSSEFHREQVADRAHRQLIQEELAKLVGEPLEISCCLRPQPAEEAPRGGKARPGGRPRTEAQEREILSRPIVRHVIDLFDGEIVE